MKIDLYPVPGVARRETLEKSVVVVDALRATSTITTAIENGCREVIPTCEVAEAVDIASRLGRSNLLLCGERQSLLINGFDLSNSPLEYTPERVGGKVLVMTTTNGTQAINASRDAKYVLLGCFLNAQSVAQMLLALKRDICIVCAGTHGRYSLDDVLAAGAIITRLERLCEVTMCDLSMSAKKLYTGAKNPQEALAGTAHYENLKALGFQADLDFCLREDVMGSVPMFSDGVIKRAVLRDA